MSVINPEEFLMFVWCNGLYSREWPLVTRDGLRVTVMEHGQPAEAGLGARTRAVSVAGARVRIGSAEVRGSVSFLGSSADRNNYGSYWQEAENSILNIALGDDPVICRADGTVVPTVVLSVPDTLMEKYRRLTESVTPCPCGSELAGMDPVYSYHILTRLALERLEQKYRDFDLLRQEARGSWDEAFYITLFKTMGRGSNSAQYVRLAGLVPYLHICRIRQNGMAVEALLLGAAGLLWPDEREVFPDDYTLTMQKEFRHQAGRFGITPMRREEWKFAGNNPNNHPVIRIVQLAAMLCSKDFLFDKLIECTSPQEVRAALNAQASEYWTTHYLPSRVGGYSEKNIGDETLDSITINLVAPMMFTYGSIKNRPELKERAVEMLESVKPEVNKYTKAWKAEGVKAENAFFSQSLIQLGKVYCPDRRCAVCGIGKMVLAAH